MENSIKEGMTPVGVQENGETIGLLPEERSGIMHLVGRPGYGKSVTLVNMVVSDIHNGRIGLVIDPHGELTTEVSEYIPADKADAVKVFEVQTGTVEENIQLFQRAIDLEEVKKMNQLLLCKVDFSTVGSGVAREFGRYVVKQFLSAVGGENCSLMLEEAYHFVDEEIVEQIIESRENGLLCILSDQALPNYRADIIERTLKAANHVISYNVDRVSAALISKYHPDIEIDELRSLETFAFIAKLNAWSTASIVGKLKLKGIYPIPYPKQPAVTSE